MIFLTRGILRKYDTGEYPGRYIVSTSFDSNLYRLLLITQTRWPRRARPKLQRVVCTEPACAIMAIFMSTRDLHLRPHQRRQQDTIRPKTRAI
jgi:hypothetical protein